MSETNTSEFGVCEPAANDQGVCEPAVNDPPHSNDISGLADINEQYESSSIKNWIKLIPLEGNKLGSPQPVSIGQEHPQVVS